MVTWQDKNSKEYAQMILYRYLLMKTGKDTLTAAQGQEPAYLLLILYIQNYCNYLIGYVKTLIVHSLAYKRK